MKKLSLLMLLSVFVFWGCSNDDDKGTGTNEITHVLSLPAYEVDTLDLGDTSNPIDTWATSYTDKGQTYVTNYFLTLLTDNSKIFEFDCTSSDVSGFGSDAFGFTNCTSGNYSAVTKKGVNSNTYVVVGASGYKVGSNYDKEVAIRFKGNNKTTYHVKGLFVTNSVYAYSSMKDGSGYFGKQEIFGDEDWFKLTIYNSDKTLKAAVSLAEGKKLLNTWKWVDLTSLGETDCLYFELSSSKTNEGGMMTPSYFCLDGITLIEK